jgi:CheY-like chemotaxis protein
MSTEVKVALIASGTSVLVAVISIVVSILSNNHSARSGKEVEKLRFELNRASTKDTIIDTQQAESLKALQLAIQSIQRVKDEIQVILSDIETGLDSKSAMNGIRSAREQMFACYEEQMATLNSSEAHIVHVAKNTSLHVETVIKRSASPAVDSILLSNEQREELMTLRMNLTEAQQLLRDKRDDRILRRLGITYNSDPHKVPESEESGISVESNLSVHDAHSLEGLRLLVVDDQPAMPQMLAMFISPYRVDVKEAASAVEALDLIINWKPDVLVTDIMMPDEDGYWLIKQVRALSPNDGGLIPAVAVTGGMDSKERERLLSAGYNKCASKPINPENLIEIIKEIAGVGGQEE